MSKRLLFSILYSALAAGLTVAAASAPEAYRELAAGAVGALLLNLRNVWQLPASIESGK